MSGCHNPNKEKCKCGCWNKTLNNILCKCECHNPTHYGLSCEDDKKGFDDNHFHVIRGLIKRVELLQESRDNHLMMINELIDRIKKLEQEVEIIKTINNVSHTNNVLVENSQYRPPFNFSETNSIQTECPNCKLTWAVHR